MGEIRVILPDELHNDLKRIAKENGLRLPEQLTAFLVWAVDEHDKRAARARLNKKNQALGKGPLQPNGEECGDVQP